MTKTEIIESLLDQAQEKDSLANGEQDSIFMEDAKALRAAVELLQRSAEVRHGRWVNARHDDYTHYRWCSVCRRTIVNSPEYDYCPRCGAKMDGGETK